MLGRPNSKPLLSLATNLLQRTSPNNPNSQTLKTLTLIPKPHNLQNPNSQPPLLLSQPTSSDQPLDLDALLKDFHPSLLTPDLLLQTLKSYKALGRPKTLEFFSWAGAQLGFRLDDPVVEFMADFLGRRKLFDDLKCLLVTVSASRGPVSPKAISICIRFLGREGRLSEALALFETMESELGCRPDNLVFNNLLYVLCRKSSSAESVDTALDVFCRIESPDKYSYSNVIVGLCRAGRLEGALEVFRGIGRASLAPTRSAANVLVGKLCESSGKTESVEKVRVADVRRPFEILVPNVGPKVGIEPAIEVFWVILGLGLLPSAHVVVGLVSELCRLQRTEEAVGIMKVVEERKLRCLGECYSLVIRALCKSLRVDRASDLFRRMGNLGLKPKVVVYNSMIRGLCKLELVEEAQKYFDIMNRQRCKPDSATYTMLIHAYGTSENWEAAYGLLMGMIDFGWSPCPNTYNLVDGLLRNNGKSDLLLKLERKMEIRSLLDHCKAGRLEDAQDKLATIHTKRFNLPIYAIDAVEHWKVEGCL
ncbi:pentatricopeptide repeat-containing protein-like isoform X2, chloroplastic [Iris pallida]|uniref:Pentatricopeptide repeat-containing protein-like isoform X2, chloroplastic n=1 Tax=Iris pallida TaxID=29817 RepID=A0AAX6EJI1_IRIPA|nr:pentatricopeptide repeat-containing protein-like isoform X2, chloroplastic [Iris pallida]